MMELKKGVLYEIYSDYGDGGCDLGYFIAKDNKHIVFQLVSTDGYDSGFILRKMDDIARFETDTIYCKKFEVLIQYRNTQFKQASFEGENLVKAFLQYAKENQSITRIELRNSDESDLFGFVDAISGKWVSILGVNSNGFRDGKGLARLKDITVVSIDDFSDFKYKFWFQNQNTP